MSKYSHNPPLSVQRSRHAEYHYNHHNNTGIPIPSNVVVTACSIYKLKLSWTAVHMTGYQCKFEYQIFAEQSQGPRMKRKITSECQAVIENLTPGAEYTFFVRAIEVSASLASDFSTGLDIRIPKDNKKANTAADTPRAAQWLPIKDDHVILSWKSPHSFHGDLSYELLFNDKVLGRCFVPPLTLSNTALQPFDFSKGSFKLRSILTAKEKKEKSESNCIQIPYPQHIREAILKQKADADQNEMIREEKEETTIRHHANSNRYIWVCTAHPLPDLTLIPFGDPEFNTYSFKTLDEENGIYLCGWPTHFIDELDHFFLFAIGDPNIHLAAVPTFDPHYKGYWRTESKEPIKFFLLYTHKVLHRVAHAISGGVQGMYHKYTAIVNCILEHMCDDITFKAAMQSIVVMHQQWSQQLQPLLSELQQLMFSKLEYYADCVDFEAMDVKSISVILLCMYWLMKTSHHKVHYRHLHHSLNGLLRICKSNDNRYESAMDLICHVMGSHVIQICTLFQSFSLEKLRKDRSRYFDLVWYQILYLCAVRVSKAPVTEIDVDIESTHRVFMSQINQILFNPMCMARPIGAEDLREITQIYLALLKPQNSGRFYEECGVKLEELIIENHIKCEDILDTIAFIHKHELSWHIFAAILYRNRNCYAFTEYSDGIEYLPELNIVSDRKAQTHSVLSRSGFYTLVQQQKIPTAARCGVIHLIFSNFKTKKDLDEKQLLLWYKVIQKLVLKHKDAPVGDQILYELRALDQRDRQQKEKHNKKHLRSFENDSAVAVSEDMLRSFEASLPICLSYTQSMIPNTLINASLTNSNHLYHILSVLLHFRHSKCDHIDNETEDDFTLHLFGILMLEFNEWFFAEKYLMRAILKRPHQPYGHYYADLALLHIVQHKDFIGAFQYISAALDKKHTECYNALVLLILYQHLIQLKHGRHNTISNQRFDLNNWMFCNYYDGERKENIEDECAQWVQRCLRNYYNALRCLKRQKYTESIQCIDEIYKYINNINIKQIQKQCADIIESMKVFSHKIANQNQALIKSQSDDINDNNDDDDDDDQKEESRAPNMVMYMPPNDDDSD